MCIAGYCQNVSFNSGATEIKSQANVPVWINRLCLPTLHPGRDVLRVVRGFFGGTQTVKNDFQLSNLMG